MTTKILLDIEISKTKVIFTYRFNKKRRKFLSIFSKYDLSSVIYTEPYVLELRKSSNSDEFLIEPKNLDYINNQLRHIFTESYTKSLKDTKTSTKLNLMT